MKCTWLIALVTLGWVQAQAQTLFDQTEIGWQAPHADATPELPARHAKGVPLVALYAGPGAWKTGLQHLKMFFAEHGFGYTSLGPEAVVAGQFEGARLLVMPGGESWAYLRDLGEQGAESVRRFSAQRGHGYLGICAGAYYAVSQREGGYATGLYGIGLLDGTAYDGTALGTSPFKAGMLDFILAVPGFASRFRSVLLGGPSFRYSEAEARAKDVHALAHFEGSPEVAMVSFRYGEGRALLSAPHIEIEEDRTNWGPDYNDPDSEWPLLDHIVRELTGSTSPAAAGEAVSG